MICPRCKNEVEERFYGPCSTCRAELRATVRWPVFARPDAELPELEVCDITSEDEVCEL